MDELKYRNPVDYMPRGNFRYAEAFEKAILRFKNVPTVMSIIRHADASEDSPLHCVPMGDFGQVDLVAPKQKAIALSAHDGGQYLAIRVTIKSDPTLPLFGEDSLNYWLVSSIPGRRGVLLTPQDFESCGGLESSHEEVLMLLFYFLVLVTSVANFNFYGSVSSLQSDERF